MIYGKKNTSIHCILIILENSLDVFKSNRRRKTHIKINVLDINEEIVIIFEDNIGGIDENLLLNMLKIIIRDKFKGQISANNTKNGLI